MKFFERATWNKDAAVATAVAVTVTAAVAVAVADADADAKAHMQIAYRMYVNPNKKRGMHNNFDHSLFLPISNYSVLRVCAYVCAFFFASFIRIFNIRRAQHTENVEPVEGKEVFTCFTRSHANSSMHDVLHKILI